MQYKQARKILSLLLSVCLMLGMVPITVFAENDNCTHEHSADCTYTEGADCTAAHTHDVDCGYDEETGAPCTFVHSHDESCGYTEAVDCTHEHDADCGGLSLGDSGNTAPAPPTLPGAPQNLIATPGDGQVVLNWTAPADDGGSEITNYEFTARGVFDGYDFTTDLTKTIPYLTNGNEYTFWVRAINAVGAGPHAIVSSTPMAPPPTFASAATNEEGTKVIVTFSKNMSTTGLAATDFTVDDGSPNVVTAIARGADFKNVELTLTTAVTSAQTVTVAYTKGTAKAVDNSMLESFAAQNVTNMVPDTSSPPVIISPNSATFTVGTNSSFNVTASNTPDSFANIGDSLPSGVSFNTSTGVLSGTPAVGTLGTYNLTFTATNAAGTSAPQSFTLTISTVTGAMNIGGTTVSNLAQDAGDLSASGWAWNASTATLTLNSGYVSSNPISIICATTDSINLVYSGTVTVNDTASVSAIYCHGNLNITGSGGTLSLTSDVTALTSNSDLQITGGTVNAVTSSDLAAAISSANGNINISGDASVTATANGASGAGITVPNGDLTISTSGTVTASAPNNRSLLGKVTINSGNVFLTSKAGNGIGPSFAVIITGGSIVVSPSPLVVDGSNKRPKDSASGADVFLATLTLDGVSTATAITGITAPAGYGISGVKTDASGKLYFWLPKSVTSVSLSTSAGTYSGAITWGNDSGTATLTTGGGTGDIASGTDWTLAADGHLTIDSDTGMSGWAAVRNTHYDSVTALAIGAGVSSIPNGAFNSCTNLASVVFDGTPTVASIDNIAFAQCASLTSFAVPASVTFIGIGAFNNTGITAFTVAGGSSYRASAADALLTYDGTTLHSFPGGKTGSYTVESGITTIGIMAFLATKLSTVVIPAGVTNIGDSAFGISSKLIAVVFEGDNPPTIGNTIFHNSNNLASIYVPAAKVTEYQSALSIYSTLVKANLGANPSVSDAAGLKAALEYPAAQTIYVTQDITLTTAVTMGASHTLSISNSKTVTASGSGGIDIGSHALTIDGSGKFVSAKDQGHALSGASGTLNLANITVELQNTYYNGIDVQTVNVGSGATVNLNSTDGSNFIRLGTGYALNVNTGGKIDIKNFFGNGIDNISGTIHINGGTISIGAGTSNNWGIINSSGLLKYTSGTLTAAANGAIFLGEDSKVEGMNGKLKDRGTAFTATGQVTVGAAADATSANGLTEGVYIWNTTGSLFAKDVITVTVPPQSVTVTQGAITQSLSVTANASNGNAVSYQWQTLTGASFVDIPSATGSTYAIPTTLTAGAYYYQCLLTATGCPTIATNDVTVTVNPAGGGTDTTAPTPGGSGTITPASVAQTTLTLNWAKATDNVSAGTALKYYIYRSDSGNITTAANCVSNGMLLNANGTADIAAYSVSGLTANTTYYFNVVVEDAAGNRAAYTMKSQATEAVPTYLVTVNSGTGGGNYAAAATVTITANTPASGQQFKEWIVNSGGVTLYKAQAASTTFTMPAGAVEVTATYEALPANTYSITVLNDGNGTANANANSATEGTPITLTATPNSGYQFKEWQVISGGVTVASNGFTMPAENVSVKAIFELIPVTTYTVTFALNGGTRTGGGALTQTVPQGGSATAPTVTRNNYTFNGWDKSFTNVTQNLTVTAQWTYNNNGGGGGSGGGSGGGGGSSGTPTTPSTSSNAPSDVSQNQATDAAQKAAGAAKAAGSGTATANMKNVGNIPLAALQAMAKAAGMPMKLQSDSMSADGKSVDVRITLDPAKSSKGLDLSASTTNTRAKETESFFEKYFNNNTSVVSLGQQGSFGQPVEIAAKIDPKLDAKNLVFYSYDKATNTYKRIEKPACWIDKNGYIHFTTELGGDIVITDKPLEKK